MPSPLAPRRPLCVDLGGTLIRSDLLVEAGFALIKQNPPYALSLPVWLNKGKAHLKQQIADRVDLDVTRLPYNAPLLDYLRAEKGQGRSLILATASNVRYAEQVALHLGLFDEVLASDASMNLSGARKRDRLVAAFRERGFDYAANDGVDLPIWEKAGAAILVDAPPQIAERVRAVTPVDQVFTSPRPDAKTYLKAIRLHQWLKNVLVFVPALMAHERVNVVLVFQASVAFIVFGLCASSVYVLNDRGFYRRNHVDRRRRAARLSRARVGSGWSGRRSRWVCSIRQWPRDYRWGDTAL